MLVGRGAYSFADAGENLGRSAGAYLGATAGRSAGSFVSTLLGRGAYSLRKNNIMTHSQGIPSFRNGKNDSVDLCHTEFLTDVIATGSTPFAIQNSYELNAGLQATFQYASQIAVGFEECEYMGLTFVYEPASGNISTSQALGTILMSTQYDMADSAFLSEVEMLDYEYSTHGVPSDPMIHPIECDPRNNPLARYYIRQGLLPATTNTNTVDPRYNAYDLGRFTVATAGVPAGAGTILGKVFSTYHFRFSKPKLEFRILRQIYPIPGGTPSTNVLYGTYSGVLATAPATINTAPTISTVPGYNALGGVLSFTGPDVLYTFPPGTQNGLFQFDIGFNISSVFAGNTLTAVNLNAPVVTNGSLASWDPTVALPVALSGMTSGTSQAVVRVTAPNAVIRFNSLFQRDPLVTGATFSGVWRFAVTQVNR